MDRRKFLMGVGAAGAGAAAAASALPKPALAQGKQEWRMVTTWPKNFPGLGVGAARLAQRIAEMSDGQLTVRVYSAGELVPALESFDAVSRGAAEMSHGAAYYWQGKSKAMNFFTGVPYGMTANELSAWIRYMGGQALWDELYAPFGVKAFMSGQTGVQAGGWFRKEINTVADLEGLKFRTPGLGGEVWKRLGVTVVNLPAGEIFQALQSGALDAAEFVNPVTDLALGFHQVAKNYYWPGFIEPGLATELTVNKAKYDALPKHLQRIIEYACQAEYEQVLADFNAHNPAAMESLTAKHGVQVRTFSKEIMLKGGEAAGQIMAELRDSGDPITKKIVESFAKAREALRGMAKISDLAYLEARELGFKYL